MQYANLKVFFARNRGHRPVIGLLCDYNCSNKASKLKGNNKASKLNPNRRE